MNFIGQNTILSYINNCTIDTLPHSLMIIGEDGCGKHSLCNIISKNLNLPLIDMTDNINNDFIQEMWSKPSPYLYIIDLNKISIKNQNSILKVLEEPSKNIFIILIINNKNYVIPTLINRCYVLEFEPYKECDLFPFINENFTINSDIILSLASTPGQVVDVSSTSKDIIELAVKIVDKINIASLPNTLSISNKLAFKEEKDLLNPFFLLKGISLYLLDKLENEDNPIYYKMFSFMNKNSHLINTPKINKKNIFEYILINLWKISRGE